MEKSRWPWPRATRSTSSVSPTSSSSSTASRLKARNGNNCLGGSGSKWPLRSSISGSINFKTSTTSYRRRRIISNHSTQSAPTEARKLELPQFITSYSIQSSSLASSCFRKQNKREQSVCLPPPPPPMLPPTSSKAKTKTKTRPPYIQMGLKTKLDSADAREQLYLISRQKFNQWSREVRGIEYRYQLNRMTIYQAHYNFLFIALILVLGSSIASLVGFTVVEASNLNSQSFASESQVIHVKVGKF